MERIGHWVQDATQAVTFAEEHAHFDGDRVGFLSISYGAINTMPILALEKRCKTALLFSGNVMSHQMFPFADAMNFYPRVTLPMLMINGRFDTIVSPNADLLRLRKKWLGTSHSEKNR